MSLAAREAYPQGAIEVAKQAMQIHATAYVGEEAGSTFTGSAEAVQLDSTIPLQPHRQGLGMMSVANKS